jgi:AraC-like DNA-binding protein
VKKTAAKSGKQRKASTAVHAAACHASVERSASAAASTSSSSKPAAAIRGTIFLWPGRWLLLSNGIQNRRHKHVAASLLFGLDGPLNIEISGQWHQLAGAIVAPEVEQALDSGGGRALVVHMDPDDTTWRHLVTALGGAEFLSLSKGQLDIQALEDAVHAADIAAAQRWLEALAMDQADSTALDERVQTVCHWLRENLPERLQLSELAALTSLSSSRLTHLFSQQMGVTMRRFLAHLKMQQALYGWKPGMQFAELAALSGFYDQPHLLRTAREMFDAMPSAIGSLAQLKVVRPE